MDKVVIFQLFFFNEIRILMAESYASTIAVLMKYYGSEKYPVAHYPFNFMFVIANEYYTSKELHGNITEWFKNMPAHGVANWVVSKVDFPFLAEKLLVTNVTSHNISQNHHFETFQE